MPRHLIPKYQFSRARRFTGGDDNVALRAQDAPQAQFQFRHKRNPKLTGFEDSRLNNYVKESADDDATPGKTGITPSLGANDLNSKIMNLLQGTPAPPPGPFETPIPDFAPYITPEEARVKRAGLPGGLNELGQGPDPGAAYGGVLRPQGTKRYAVTRNGIHLISRKPTGYKSPEVRARYVARAKTVSLQLERNRRVAGISKKGGIL